MVLPGRFIKEFANADSAWRTRVVWPTSRGPATTCRKRRGSCRRAVKCAKHRVGFQEA